jgi:hypothetical protein
MEKREDSSHYGIVYHMKCEGEGPGGKDAVVWCDQSLWWHSEGVVNKSELKS